MPAAELAVDAADVAAWCTDHLRSPPTQQLFRSGHLSVVIGLRLADGREVVVKVRPASPRVAGCLEVQRRLFAAGYPCPEPLAGPAPLGDGTATAETHVPGGRPPAGAGGGAQRSAEAFARLVELAPRPEEVPSLAPAPSWAAWDHPGPGPWPRLEAGEVDLDAVAGPPWLARAARRARDRLRVGTPATVVGHCDWLADNLGWQGEELVVVHDWDSAVVDHEAVLVGFAAALHSTVGGLATVAETEDFLTAYRAARPQALTGDELGRAWAAGVWTRAVDAQEQHLLGHPVTALTEPDADERLRRSGDLGAS